MRHLYDMYESYPDDLVNFARRANIRLPKISTVGGQALALLSQPSNRGGNYFFTPEETTEFFKNIGLNTRDSIQPFNKPCGNKLQLVTEKPGLYSLKYPYELKANDITKRIDVDKHVLKNGSKEEQVSLVKKYWLEKVKDKQTECGMLLECLRVNWKDDVYVWLKREMSGASWIYNHILDVPPDRWQIGHLDASKGNDPENLFYQPPIQARFRDNYIFNKYFERIKVKV
jgi:hypothetical protein